MQIIPLGFAWDDKSYLGKNIMNLSSTEFDQREQSLWKNAHCVLHTNTDIFSLISGKFIYFQAKQLCRKCSAFLLKWGLL